MKSSVQWLPLAKKPKDSKSGNESVSGGRHSSRSETQPARLNRRQEPESRRRHDRCTIEPISELPDLAREVQNRVYSPKQNETMSYNQIRSEAFWLLTPESWLLSNCPYQTEVLDYVSSEHI
jgi:hypothetical protein